MSTATRSVLVERGPVNLGCGTLILIALIVLFFSNRPDDNTRELKTEIQRLRTNVEVLQSVINKQTAQLKELQQLIRRQNNNEKAPAQPQAPAKE